MNKIEKIRQEIERLKGICTAQIKANPGQTFPFVMEMTGYDKILSFLDALSEEPDKSLVEAAEEYEQTRQDTDARSDNEIVRRAFIVGAKWQADHAPLPEDTVLFQKGVKEGKRLMMEDAVEGEVVNDINNKLAVTAKNVNLDRFNFGDKVRIIIVKEEKNGQSN